jgi:hypothetical protein
MATPKLHSYSEEEKPKSRRSPSVEDPEGLAAWPIPDDEELERAISRTERGTEEPKLGETPLSRTISAFGDFITMGPRTGARWWY